MKAGTNLLVVEVHVFEGIEPIGGAINREVLCQQLVYSFDVFRSDILTIMTFIVVESNQRKLQTFIINSNCTP
jgi:hypothetical protein